MVSAKQASANKANAAKSTGPRSEGGKLRSSRNALMHGLTSPSPLLPGESPQDYAELHKGLLEHFRPATVLERTLVDRLASTIWRLRRVPAFEAAIMRPLLPPTDFDLWLSKSLCSYAADESVAEASNSALAPYPAPTTDLLERITSGAHNLDTLTKLTRYESQLSRQVDRILEQLRQLQREDLPFDEDLPTSEDVPTDENRPVNPV